VEKAFLETSDYQERLPTGFKAGLFKRPRQIYEAFPGDMGEENLPQVLFPTVLAFGKKAENLKYKKGSIRRRAYTRREATEEQEKERRRRYRAASIEAGR
jgi:hypothetical protein